MAMKFFDFDSYDGLSFKLSGAVRGLSREQFVTRPVPGKWSILEILSHIEDHVITQAFRIRKLVSEPGTTLPGVDQDSWVLNLRANERDVEELLNTIRVVVRSNAILLSRLDEEDWEKTAVNPLGETVPLSSVVQGFVNHILHHIEQIKRLARHQSLST